MSLRFLGSTVPPSKLLHNPKTWAESAKIWEIPNSKKAQRFWQNIVHPPPNPNGPRSYICKMYLYADPLNEIASKRWTGKTAEHNFCLPDLAKKKCIQIKCPKWGQAVGCAKIFARSNLSGAVTGLEVQIGGNN